MDVPGKVAAAPAPEPPEMAPMMAPATAAATEEGGKPFDDVALARLFLPLSSGTLDADIPSRSDGESPPLGYMPVEGSIADRNTRQERLSRIVLRLRLRISC